MKIETLMNNLKFNELSPIQTEVIKSFPKNQNIVGLAPTGTGKTHAYLFPLLINLKRIDNQVEAVILVPTNELVIQVGKMLSATDSTVSYKTYYGSMDMKREEQRLKNNQPNVIITTPQKLVDLVITHNALNVKHLKYFILDEADMMFDESFMEMIDPILSNVDVDKFLLFSATLNQIMAPFIKKYFGSHIFIDTTKESILDIEYQLIKFYDDRLNSLKSVLKRINPFLALIFVSKNDDIELVYSTLRKDGYNAVQISSKFGVKERKNIIDDIINLKYQYVVTSDLLSRGIDFKVSHVIHYDLPYHLEYFKHRSGRTARMGDSGIVITLYNDKDQRDIDRLRGQGIPFVNAVLTKDGIQTVKRKSKTYDKRIANAIRSVKKPKRVSPGYKKKHAAKVNAEIKKVKKARYRDADLRKSRITKG